MAEITGNVTGFDKYLAYFYDKKTTSIQSYSDKGRVGYERYNLIEDEAWDKFRILDGDTTSIDTGLEWLLTTYYSPAVVNARPVEAAKLLPANSRESEVKLAAATYAELQEIRFLDPQNSGRIGRYEGMLKFITDKQKITQAEISASLRASIHAVVDAEFNRVGFSFENASHTKGYNAVLTRNAQNQYILSYEGYFGGKTWTKKELTALSLEALLVAMRGNTADFDQSCIDNVRAQAALMPAVVYESRKDTSLVSVKSILTSFYANPSQGTYNKLKELYATYSVTNNDPMFKAMFDSFEGTVSSLNRDLSDRIYQEIHTRR